VGNVVGLVVADHQRVFVEGLTMLLDAEPTLTVLGVAYNGRQVVELAAKHRPVVLLFDVYMSGGDLAGTVAAVKRASPATKVLLLAPDGRRIMVAAIAAGADGLVTKDMSSRQVVAAIHTAVAGRPVMVLGSQPAGLGRDAGVGWLRLTALSDREREVLGLLARGWSTRRIAQDWRVAESTVRGHVQGVLDKLDVHSKLEAAAFAWEHGIVAMQEVMDGHR
jgi:DNA-binding NarL/FixJ family response regulator